MQLLANIKISNKIEAIKTDVSELSPHKTAWFKEKIEKRVDFKQNYVNEIVVNNVRMGNHIKVNVKVILSR